MLLFLTTTAFALPVALCERVYKSSEVEDALDAAEAKFSSQDAAGFASSHAAVASRISCLGEPLVPEVLARIYLVEALKAFLGKNSSGTAAALAGMAASSPGYQIPLALVPDGHPVRKAMSRAGQLLRDPAVAALNQPATGWIEADGEHRAEAATNRDVVLQRFGADGKVVETRYVHVGEPLEDWTVVPRAAATKEAPSGSWSSRHVSGEGSGGGASLGRMQGKPHVEGGFELGFPIGLRLGYHVEGDVVRSFGARCLLTPAFGFEDLDEVGGILGPSGYVDFIIGDVWDLEASFGGGLVGYDIGTYGGLAVQYDPYTFLQVNLGIFIGVSEEYAWLAPDVTVGFVW